LHTENFCKNIHFIFQDSLLYRKFKRTAFFVFNIVNNYAPIPLFPEWGRYLYFLFLQLFLCLILPVKIYWTNSLIILLLCHILSFTCSIRPDTDIRASLIINVFNITVYQFNESLWNKSIDFFQKKKSCCPRTFEWYFQCQYFMLSHHSYHKICQQGNRMYVRETTRGMGKHVWGTVYFVEKDGDVSKESP